MEFKDNEKISIELSNYIKTYTNNNHKLDYKKISVKFGFNESTALNLIYRKAKFYKKHTDLMLKILSIAIHNRNKNNNLHEKIQ